jgi:hypothetical protein
MDRAAQLLTIGEVKFSSMYDAFEEYLGIASENTLSLFQLLCVYKVIDVDLSKFIISKSDYVIINGFRQSSEARYVY